jgi:SAM-dependent methyltransferase
LAESINRVLPLSISEETITAYSRVASEYCGREHETTRGLEEATRRAWREAVSELPSHLRAILEIGAGSGSTTRELVRTFPRSKITATDAAPTMLKVARVCLAGFDVCWRVATAAEAIGAAAPGDLVVAGLADPFLDAGVLGAVPSGATVFVTVPTRAWAVRERSYRLQLPLERTRFRLKDGTAVQAASFPFDAEDLQALAEEAALDISRGGTVRATGLKGRPVPEVSWLLASRL